MPLIKTVAFADLTGSVGLFESLGNAQATDTITRLTNWIGTQCQWHGGEVIKLLGDGVLATFDHPGDAVDAMVSIQRQHKHRVASWPANMHMGIKVGLALGELVQAEGDWYGDAINTASRLSDMAGSMEIWATELVIADMEPAVGTHFRSLGPMTVRGRQEPVDAVRIEWDENLTSEYLTMPATLDQRGRAGPARPGGRITLYWHEQLRTYAANQMPVHLGRASDADFEVQHPRVSRLHARLNWRDGAFVLVDVSSYGSWVKFDGSDRVLALRRLECVLHGQGQIALGAPFTDGDVPVVHFTLDEDATRPSVLEPESEPPQTRDQTG